jgi:hypothetical protein
VVEAVDRTGEVAEEVLTDRVEEVVFISVVVTNMSTLVVMKSTSILVASANIIFGTADGGVMERVTAGGLIRMSAATSGIVSRSRYMRVGDR